MDSITGTRPLLVALRSPRPRDRVGIAAGLAVLGGLVAADVVLGASAAITSAYMIAPFISATLGAVWATALLDVLMLAAGAASGAWHMNTGYASYWVRLGVLGLGGGLALVGAWAREWSRIDSRRLQVLNEVGSIADGSLPLDETLRRVTELIVPIAADACLIDVIHDGEVMRAAVRAAGTAEAGELEEGLRRRTPSVPPWFVEDVPQWRALPRFLPRMRDEDVKRLSHDSEDLAFLRRLGPRSSIATPMIARGRSLGALTMLTAWSNRRYSLRDLRFAQILASRVALALDNAGIFSDLESVERRMDAVMSMLDEAVLVHDRSGRVVYANQAAAELLGYGTPQELLDAPAPEVDRRLELRGQEGEPIRLGTALRRQDGSAVARRRREVIRMFVRRSGEERWAMATSEPIPGADGQLLYLVTTLDDITDIKRAEFAQAEVARTLQRGLLPPALPRMPGWVASAMYRPAGELSEVGGDFYDAFETSRGWMVVVGDVVGRGAKAAALTALARYTIRTAGSLSDDPRVALRLLNDALRDRPPTAICSVVLLTLPRGEADPAEVELISAGHPPALLVRGGAVEELPFRGPLLGALDSPVWEPRTVEIGPGDQLVLYTDGVTDVKGGEERFGEHRLRTRLAGMTSPEAGVASLEAALDSFVDGALNDDAAAVIIQRLPAVARAQTVSEAIGTAPVQG